MIMFLLIRHGENDLIKYKLAGRLPEVHLNAEGKQQAIDLVPRLVDIPIQAIFSSPLERAIETAEPLAVSRNLPVQMSNRLIELDYGKWQGRTYKQLARSKMWQIVKSNPSAVRFPGGETFSEVQKRVVDEIEAIFDSFCSNNPDTSSQAPNNPQAIACFTHGDTIRLILCHYLNMRIDDFQRLMINPASITVLRLEKDKPPIIPHINLVGHLHKG